MRITRELANAAAIDAANRQMKANGRSSWDEDDYNLACEVFEKLWPVRVVSQTLRGKAL